MGVRAAASAGRRRRVPRVGRRTPSRSPSGLVARPSPASGGRRRGRGRPGRGRGSDGRRGGGRRGDDGRGPLGRVGEHGGGAEWGRQDPDAQGEPPAVRGGRTGHVGCLGEQRRTSADARSPSSLVHSHLGQVASSPRDLGEPSVPTRVTVAWRGMVR